MRTDDAGTLCPHCGTATAVSRGGGPILPGGLYLHEFEILVRNEWRRRLGPEAYDRAHEARIVRTLAGLVAARDSGHDAELRDEVDQMVADIAAVGRGRGGVRREAGELLRAMESVFTKVDAHTAATKPIIASARRAIESALGYSLE